MSDYNMSMESKVDRILEKETFFSKYVFQIVTIIFLAGGGWVGLNNVEALAQDNKEAISQEKEERSTIKEKLVKVETTQEFIKDEIKETKDQVKENSDKLDAILEELRKD